MRSMDIAEHAFHQITIDTLHHTPMLNAIIRFSLRYRLLTIAVAVGRAGVRRLRPLPPADRRVPRPGPAARHRDDRGAGPGAGGSRNAGHLSAGIGPEWGDRRAGGPQFVGHRALGGPGRVRLGHRHLRRPADRRRETRPGRRPAAGGRPAAIGADLLDHGPDHDRRHVERRGQDDADGSPHAGRLGRAAAAA